MSINNIPRVADISPVGSNGIYRITMEDGYWIHKPAFGENVWKTVTFIHPNEDLTSIEIRATDDLPEDAELLGRNTVLNI